MSKTSVDFPDPDPAFDGACLPLHYTTITTIVKWPYETNHRVHHIYRPLLDAGGIICDDVTRMNATAVSRVFHVLCKEDIQRVLRDARANGKRVSVRGTKHSMGAHTIAADGYVIDCRFLKDLSYNEKTCVVTTGAGNTWADLIKCLNDYGRSPRTMQSYSTFSVGGTIAVGAHGITTDVPVSESVEWVRLVDPQGNIVEARRGDELLKNVLGGYGKLL